MTDFRKMLEPLPVTEVIPKECLLPPEYMTVAVMQFDNPNEKAIMPVCMGHSTHAEAMACAENMHKEMGAQAKLWIANTRGLKRVDFAIVSHSTVMTTVENLESVDR